MPVNEGELNALSLHRGDCRVLLTAAFARPENDEAAAWLLRSVWPLVLDQLPQARLVLAGAGPSDSLRELAKDNMVEVTGYVEDLHDYYRTADLFVVPLKRGAGVKFKTITAMLWAIPVVSTPAGAEGIGERGNYVDVTSDPATFAEAIVSALQERPAAMIRRTWLWAHSTYGVEVFEHRVRELYNQ
nr:glycosyltransferase family 4 protein [Plantibacter sp. T3]